MRILLTIAWRNILRHKGKSLVIGVILFLGSFIMTLGNGVISGMDRGLSENIVNRFIGHIVILSSEQETDNILFTPMGKETVLIKEYDKLIPVLKSQPFIDKFLPAGKGLGLILSDEGDVDFTWLLGVNFEDYNAMFMNNVKLSEGSLLKNSERGLLFSEGKRTRLFDDQNIWVKPVGQKLKEDTLSENAKKYRKQMIIKDNLVFLGAAGDSASLDIRIDVKGIIHYEQLNDFWKIFSIMDIQSFRECFQWITHTTEEAGLSKSAKALLQKTDNLDDLFNESTLENVSAQKSDTAQDYRELRKKSKAQVLTDPGAYNLVFVKLKPGENTEERAANLNKALVQGGTKARAVTWQNAIGQLGDMAMIIRGALAGFVFLIFFVAIIIIMNTLSMAAMERTAEIGMMRAVGAGKTFISAMFYLETIFLSAVFGGAGILIGMLTVKIAQAMQITAENNILQLLFGGKVFQPWLGTSDIMLGIIELSVVTVLAALYPARLASRITPLEAISRE